MVRNGADSIRVMFDINWKKKTPQKSQKKNQNKKIIIYQSPISFPLGLPFYHPLVQIAAWLGEQTHAEVQEKTAAFLPVLRPEWWLCQINNNFYSNSQLVQSNSREDMKYLHTMEI